MRSPQREQPLTLMGTIGAVVANSVFGEHGAEAESALALVPATLLRFKGFVVEGLEFIVLDFILRLIHALSWCPQFPHSHQSRSTPSPSNACTHVILEDPQFGHHGFFAISLSSSLRFRCSSSVAVLESNTSTTCRVSSDSCFVCALMFVSFPVLGETLHSRTRCLEMTPTPQAYPGESVPLAEAPQTEVSL